MTTRLDRLVGILADRLSTDPVLRDQIGPIDDLDWTEVEDGIEAPIGPRVLRVEPDKLVITHSSFGSATRIPLK
jgi:hypothetical protein